MRATESALLGYRECTVLAARGQRKRALGIGQREDEVGQRPRRRTRTSTTTSRPASRKASRRAHSPANEDTAAPTRSCFLHTHSSTRTPLSSRLISDLISAGRGPARVGRADPGGRGPWSSGQRQDSRNISWGKRGAGNEARWLIWLQMALYMARTVERREH